MNLFMSALLILASLICDGARASADLGVQEVDHCETSNGTACVSVDFGDDSNSTFDASAPEIIDLKPNVGVKPVYDLSSYVFKYWLDSEICTRDYTPTATTRSGAKIKMLGHAFVYMDQQSGTSVFGHLAERFIYCRNDKFIDVVYEEFPLEADAFYDVESDSTLQFGESQSKEFSLRFGTKPEELSADYVRSLSKSMLIQVNYAPPQLYGSQQILKNRTIYEAWFKSSEEMMYRVLIANEDRRRDQNAKIKSQTSIPGFTLFGDHKCTANVQKDLVIMNPAYEKRGKFTQFTPAQVWGHVKGQSIDKIVVYPSQRLFRILQMKKNGQATFLESLAPFAKTMTNMNGGWSFVTLDTMRVGRLKNFVTPIAGMLNTGTAVAETIFGALTIPVTGLGKLFRVKRLRSQKMGVYRMKMGLMDILASLAETAFIRLRYPMASEWSAEESEFLKGFAQTSVVLEYLQTKYQEAPLYIDNNEPSQ